MKNQNSNSEIHISFFQRYKKFAKIAFIFLFFAVLFVLFYPFLNKKIEIQILEKRYELRNDSVFEGKAISPVVGAKVKIIAEKEVFVRDTIKNINFYDSLQKKYSKKDSIIEKHVYLDSVFETHKTNQDGIIEKILKEKTNLFSTLLNCYKVPADSFKISVLHPDYFSEEAYKVKVSENKNQYGFTLLRKITLELRLFKKEPNESTKNIKNDSVVIPIKDVDIFIDGKNISEKRKTDKYGSVFFRNVPKLNPIPLFITTRGGEIINVSYKMDSLLAKRNDSTYVYDSLFLSKGKKIPAEIELNWRSTDDLDLIILFFGSQKIDTLYYFRQNIPNKAPFDMKLSKDVNVKGETQNPFERVLCNKLRVGEYKIYVNIHKRRTIERSEVPYVLNLYEKSTLRKSFRLLLKILKHRTRFVPSLLMEKR